ncbi:hypothetical protein ACP3V5_08075 [Vibrio maritimus]
MKDVTTALLASTLAFPALAADNDEWIVDAKRNFGRVLQDPLGNFRGVISLRRYFDRLSVTTWSLFQDSLSQHHRRLLTIGKPNG